MASILGTEGSWSLKYGAEEILISEPLLLLVVVSRQVPRGKKSGGRSDNVVR